MGRTTIAVDRVLLQAIHLAGLDVGGICRRLTGEDDDVEDPHLTACRDATLADDANEILQAVRLVPTMEPMMLMLVDFRVGDDPRRQIRYGTQNHVVGQWRDYCSLKLYFLNLPDTMVTGMPGSTLWQVVRHPVLDVPDLEIDRIDRSGQDCHELMATPGIVEVDMEDGDLPLDLIAQVLNRRDQAQIARQSRTIRGDDHAFGHDESPASRLRGDAGLSYRPADTEGAQVPFRPAHPPAG